MGKLWVGKRLISFQGPFVTQLPLISGVGASCVSMGLLIFLWLLILPVCRKDLAGVTLGSGGLQCLADEVVPNFP